ncbi:MAG: family 65 glycosyl hydrolase domain-containing protein [Bacteroidales bacterium]|jgi:maltose phosphorylase|nr:family 65 glycosyl hydrolase domain-containing protein [Bacteroidales bacterium]
MNKYLIHDEWCIIEKDYKPENHKSSESIFSIGNGKLGQRANFEEQYSGDSLQGNYIAGIYYPDKTKVGWWKNGYPEYFAKVLNAPNWIGINIKIDNLSLDLAKCKNVSNFKKTLNMQEGYLEREFIAELTNGKIVNIKTKRFLSIVNDELGAIKYEISPVNFSGKITISPYLDADIINEDANYKEKFWIELDQYSKPGEAHITTKTKKLNFEVCTSMRYAIERNGNEIVNFTSEEKREKYISHSVEINAKTNDSITCYKYASVTTSENYNKKNLSAQAYKNLDYASKKGFDKLLLEQSKAWENKWKGSDIVIEGDTEAQQGIRFNIFQLGQTYTGKDQRLNIGPKGFTGEKYGGSTYWDTEAYCLPFYLSTSEPSVGKNLLFYRYKQLSKAIENAEKLGFKNGAALYPMVTMNGEESHNEWEITFEEIHRNGAIARAIYKYTEYTGDNSYVQQYGIEVLIAIARFWSQRVNFSEAKQKYVILGVTGPNEYENNVNNNWYTNYIAKWCLSYAIKILDEIKISKPQNYKTLIHKVNLSDEELPFWKKLIKNIYLPKDDKKNIYLQQDNFLDKEIKPAESINISERPINQNWSWDRILRSCYIKQADVLQGLYFFETDFDEQIIKRNFDFYEPLTVHESSLSPCVHSIMASKLKYRDKAYELYLRTARLDLDDYNDEVSEGCHITSMAGTWLSFVEGFGGMRIRNKELHFSPYIPNKWKSYSFNIKFRGQNITLQVLEEEIKIFNYSDKKIELYVLDKKYAVLENNSISIKIKN